MNFGKVDIISLKLIFCLVKLIIIFSVNLEASVPREETDSWWDRVGRPESVETLCKTKKMAKLTK